MSRTITTRNRPPRLSYTIEDFCDATGVARTAVYRAISQGELTTYKYGRRRYVSAAAAQAWLVWIEAGGKAPRARK